MCENPRHGVFFFFQAEDGIRDGTVTGVQTCALPIFEEHKIDLVVMGSRGRSYFERMLLGSVTERMLRKLHVPILTVSHLDPNKELHGLGAVPMRKLLYAT